MIRALALLLLAFTTPAVAGPLDTAARDYVRLTLEAGTHEEGYVDAYYGPPAWAAEAKAHPRSVPALRREVERGRRRCARSTRRGSHPTSGCGARSCSAS